MTSGLRSSAGPANTLNYRRKRLLPERSEGYVNWERRRAFVPHAKGRKQRWVGIDELAASALRDYVDRFRGEREGMLLLSRRGEPLTAGNSLRVILRRIGDAVGG